MVVVRMVAADITAVIAARLHLVRVAGRVVIDNHWLDRWYLHERHHYANAAITELGVTRRPIYLYEPCTI